MDSPPEVSGAIERLVGPRPLVHALAQHGLERREVPEAAVVPEAEFVEVRLQVLRLDAAVVRSLQPQS